MAMPRSTRGRRLGCAGAGFVMVCIFEKEDLTKKKTEQNTHAHTHNRAMCAMCAVWLDVWWMASWALGIKERFFFQ